MSQHFSDDFIIVRYHVWYNFVAAKAPITREALDVQDIVALIDDIGEDWKEKSKRGYRKVPPLNDAVADLKGLIEMVAQATTGGVLQVASRTAILDAEAKRLCKKYGFFDYWSED